MKLTGLFFAACFAAALAPFSERRPLTTEPVNAFPGWAGAHLPSGLSPLELSARDARFAGDFPGRVGVFTDGRRTFIVRWVAQPTRRLHPTADCLRGLGYEVSPAPVFVAPDGTHWGASKATCSGERVRALERIFDDAGREWTDVSAWYWPAAFNRSHPPWWAVTVLEPM